MEFSIRSPSNIAFIKYWGQRNSSLVLPSNDSFSMNLSNCYTDITVERVEDPSVKEMIIKEFKTDEYTPATNAEMQKVLAYYDVAKKYLGVANDTGFRIRSANSFPKKAGIASSASFFSAMALAFTKIFGKDLDKKQLSILARLSGSGSACRSIPDGFSWWKASDNSEESYAESIEAPDYWDLRDIVLVLSFDEKKVSSAEGHQGAQTSRYFNIRQQALTSTLQETKNAFQMKDFTAFGTLIEQEAINFHSILMTQVPPLFFWSESTVRCIKEIVKLREDGLEGFFTIDAGENIHLICEGKNEAGFSEYFLKQEYVKEVIINSAAKGTHFL